MAFQKNLYINVFVFSEIMDQMFLTGRGGVQDSFRATLGVAFVFIHDILRPEWGAWRCPHPLGFFFGVNLDYLDFSSGIFDL